MKAQELRNLAADNLRQQLEESKRELFNLRFRTATRQLTDVSQIQKTRRNIARILTILREHELS